MAKIRDLLGPGPDVLLRVLPAQDRRGVEQPRAAVDELEPLQPQLRVGHLRRRRQHPGPDPRPGHRHEPRARLPGDGPPHLRRATPTTQVKELLDEYAEAGVENILALGGDPPADGSDPGGRVRPTPASWSSWSAARRDFSVGVAAQPELHPRSPDRESDRRYLAEKLRDGRLRRSPSSSSTPTTTCSWSTSWPTSAVDTPGAARRSCCSQPRRPDQRMSAMNQSKLVPADLVERLDAAGDDEADGASHRRRDRHRAVPSACSPPASPGLHFYTLNRSEPRPREIYIESGPARPAVA